MQLVGLQPLCWLCHGAKHIGCSRSKGILPQVKEHLRKVYRMKDEELDRIESEAAEKAERLKTRIPRELDLTYLNHERFGQVHQMLQNCRLTSFDS
jgi:hypothetical protein